LYSLDPANEDDSSFDRIGKDTRTAINITSVKRRVELQSTYSI